MKRLLLSASIALMLLSSTAFAAPRHGDHDDHGSAWNHDRDGDRGNRGDRDDWDRDDHRRHHDHHRDDDRRRDYDRDDDPDRDYTYESWHDAHDGRWSDRRYYSDHDNGRHRGFYHQNFRRGERVPVVYMQPRYYVQDWRAYRLAPPPRGYVWVRPPDGRFLLVAAATGLIAEILGY